MRIEVTLTCLIKNFPSIDQRDSAFLSQFNKDEELARDNSSRFRDIVSIEEGNPKFFDVEYRKVK